MAGTRKWSRWEPDLGRFWALWGVGCGVRGVGCGVRGVVWGVWSGGWGGGWGVGGGSVGWGVRGRVWGGVLGGGGEYDLNNFLQHQQTESYLLRGGFEGETRHGQGKE